MLQKRSLDDALRIEAEEKGIRFKAIGLALEANKNGSYSILPSTESYAFTYSNPSSGFYISASGSSAPSDEFSSITSRTEIKYRRKLVFSEENGVVEVYEKGKWRDSFEKTFMAMKKRVEQNRLQAPK